MFLKKIPLKNKNMSALLASVNILFEALDSKLFDRVRSRGSLTDFFHGDNSNVRESKIVLFFFSQSYLRL